MPDYSRAEAADRGGVPIDEVSRIVDLGIVAPAAGDRFTTGDVRRLSIVHALVGTGIPMEGLGKAIRDGQVSLAFLDAPVFERFSAFSGETFAQVAARTGVPVQLLMQIREAAGSPAPLPDDLLRDEELPSTEVLALAFEAGFRPAALQQMMRVQADGLRRMAETEANMWESELIRPAVEAGRRPDEVLGIEFGDRMGVMMERAVLGMYHLQQSQAWGSNIIEAVEMQLAAAGLHSRLEHPPAMCFLDITGYTRLTEERGDEAAAEMADQLGRLVQRISVTHGGRPVKWLGDGVMFHFPQPGPGVLAALEMVAGVTEAGLPPAHVGLHAGPVIFQEGDYYGQTVNVAARIADYARPAEVIVSRAVVEASGGAGVAFTEIGPVELKGVAGTMELHAAHKGS